MSETIIKTGSSEKKNNKGGKKITNKTSVLNMNALERIAFILKNTKYPPLLIGEAGCGKTDFIKQLGEIMGLDVIIITLSQMEPGDILGMPKAINMVSGEQRKISDNNDTISLNSDFRTDFIAPTWWPTEKCIIFLDEINRAHPSVRNAVMQLVLDRGLLNRPLPEGTKIVAAANPSTDDYADVDALIDKAFLDRWVIYQFNPTLAEWLSWMRENSNLSYLHSYMTEHPTYYPGNKLTFDLPDVKITQRSYVRAMDIINCYIDKVVKDSQIITQEMENDITALACDVLTANHGSPFSAHIIKKLKLVRNTSLITSILNNYSPSLLNGLTSTDRLELFFACLKQYTSPIIKNAKKTEDNMFAFFNDMEPEQQYISSHELKDYVQYDEYIPLLSRLHKLNNKIKYND